MGSIRAFPFRFSARSAPLTAIPGSRDRVSAPSGGNSAAIPQRRGDRSLGGAQRSCYSGVPGDKEGGQHPQLRVGMGLG